MKDSFILYCSQYPAIETLSNAAKGELLDALYHYVMEDKVPVFSAPEIHMAFNFIRIAIDRDQTKYRKMCELRKEAGRRGGRPRKAQGDDTTKANKANGFSKSNETICENKNPDNDIRLSKDNHDNNEFTDVNSKTKKTKKSEAPESFDFNDEEKDTNAAKKWEAYYVGFVRCFNATMQSYGSAVKMVKSLSDERREAIYHIVNKYHYSVDDIRTTFRHIATSNYCNGRTSDRKRPVDFDWLIKEHNFTRAFEGSL